MFMTCLKKTHRNGRLLIFALLFFSCNGNTIEPKIQNEMTNLAENMDTVTFGAGCFWCVEAIFEQLDGVSSVVSGYSGGETNDPDYKSVCAGISGNKDRKSTRLNSSHVKNSYPVFCLKKKKPPTKSMTDRQYIHSS